MPKKYDFAGWVTKNDTLCADGLVIKQDAFKGNDKAKVPLVWEHDHKTPDNVLGHMILHNQPEGVYGYGFFNESEQASTAKQLLKHGDISSMSIAANKLKKMGSDVVHGRIFEVSLVLAGANPGALIDEIVTHSDGNGGEEFEAIIYTKNLIHSAGDVIADPNFTEGGNNVDGKENETKPDNQEKPEGGEKTIGDVLDSMTEEQKDAVEALLAGAIEQVEEGGKQEENPGQEDNTNPDPDGGEEMKHNVFEGKEENSTTLKHSAYATLSAEIATAAKEGKGTLKEIIAHAAQDNEVLQHGITNIEELFPEATLVTNAPVVFGPHNTEASKILAGTKKVPFSRIKSHFADLTEDEARARGYIKGKEKKEQFFKIVNRETYPQTIYKKQKLDRDDIIDITDFDIVPFINSEMRMMLDEELARAILVGDGRTDGDESKIQENKIRPIVTDDDTFVIKADFKAAEDFLETIVMNIADLRGSGSYTMYADPKLISRVRLLKGTDGRFLSGSLPSLAELAAQFGVKEIVPTEIMSGHGALIVNLNDYNLGATKGGQVTTFDDFDIDFNQYKYLIETRLSGALVLPKCALLLTENPSGTTTTTTSTTTTTTTQS